MSTSVDPTSVDPNQLTIDWLASFTAKGHEVDPDGKPFACDKWTIAAPQKAIYASISGSTRARCLSATSAANAASQVAIFAFIG